MAIVIGGGGGSGDGVPTGAIIITGKDMTEESYGNLSEDLILHRDNEPDLWEIYKEDAGDFDESKINYSATENVIFRIYNDLFMRITADNKLSIFREFDGSDTEVSTISDVDFDNSRYVGVLENRMVFSNKSSTITVVDFNPEAGELQNILNSFIVRSFDLTQISFNNDYNYLTTKGLMCCSDLNNVATIPLNEDFGDISKITYDDFSALPNYTDPLTEKHITTNGFLISRGRAFNLETFESKNMTNTDHGSAFSTFTMNGKDYFSSRGQVWEMDKNFNVERITVNGTSTSEEFADIYYSIGGTLTGVIGSFSPSALATKNINGVTSNLSEQYTLNYSTAIDYASRSSRLNLFDGGVIGRSTLDNTKAVFIKFRTEAPDIFTIDAVDSISTDKSAWIKLQRKGLL